MTRRVLENFCTEKDCVDFLAPILLTKNISEEICSFLSFLSDCSGFVPSHTRAENTAIAGTIKFFGPYSRSSPRHRGPRCSKGSMCCRSSWIPRRQRRRARRQVGNFSASCPHSPCWIWCLYLSSRLACANVMSEREELGP